MDSPRPRSRVPSDAMELLEEESPNRVRFDKRSASRKLSDPMRWGATIMPIRSAPDGSLEVLCAQNTVVNYLKSEPGHRVLVDFPGEFRLLGALWKPTVDVTPLDTAIRGLTSAGLKKAQRYIRSYVAEREELGFAALRAMLFDVTLQANGTHKTFHFVCSMSRRASDRFVNLLNQFLESQQACCEAKGDQLFEIPEALRAQLCPMFHKVAWWRIDELLKTSDSDFVNEYQRTQLLSNGRGSRVFENAHMDMLRRLRKFTVDQVFQQCMVRETALLSVPREKWDDVSCGELEPLIAGFPDLGLLSFNMNILPFGVASMRGHESLHSSARLQSFLQKIRQEVEAEALTAKAERIRAPDIIAVQELFASPFVPFCCAQSFAVRIMASLGYNAVIGPNPTVLDLVRRGKTDSGLVIFSRLPVVETRSIRFGAGAALDAGACKGAMWARFELASGRYLDVFNCHLQASHTGADADVFERIRRSQIKELREFIELSGTEHPYVLTGDFNVDAIPEPSDPMGTYGIPFRPPRQESEDYQRLVVALDPKGRLVDLLCGPTLQDPLGTEARDGKRHPCTRPPRLRMPSSAGYVARHKYPQRLDYVFYRPTVSSLIEHEQSRVEPFEVVDQPFEYLSDHFGIRASFRFRCSFAWARAKCSQSQQLPKWRRILSTLSKHSLEVSLCIISVPVLWQTWRHERMNTISSHLWAMLELLGVPKRWAVHWRICGGLLGALLPSLLLRRWQWQLDESPVLERTMSVTAELASSAFRKRLKAQSERPGKTVASSPYDNFNGSVESYRLRPCIGRRSVNSDGTLGAYTWMSYGDAQFEVLRISSGLHRKFGLARKSQVGLLGDSSGDWLLCDLACMRLGVNTVCLAAPATHPTTGTTAPVPGSIQGLEVLLCSSDWVEYFVLTTRRVEELPRCPIVTFTPLTARIAALAQHKGLKVWDLPFIAHFGEVAGWVPYIGVGGFDVLTTMYRSRSGTKSELAGVSVNLRDLAVSVDSVRRSLGLTSDDRHFSYIWPAFTAERLMLHAVLASGGAIGFFGGVRSPRIFEDIKRLQPTFLAGTASLFRRQIMRLQLKHVGFLGNLSYRLQRWALIKCKAGTDKSESLDFDEEASFMNRLAKCFLSQPMCRWLNRPFVVPRQVLLGSKTRLRFVLALCGAGTTALPPDRCLWMRLLLGCPVLKSFVSVEAGGMVTLGEAPYAGETSQAFAVGHELPGVQMELLPLKLPEDIQPLEVLGSRQAGIELGTLKIRGLCTNEARIGIVVGRRNRELFVYGRLVSLQESCARCGALCEALEQLLLQVTGAWLMQLLLVAKPLGVVGVAAVRLDEVWRLAKFWNIDGPSSGEDLCRDRRVIQLCLRELQKHATRFGFSEAEKPRMLHLQATPFSLEAGLQTPTFQLRRDQLLPRVDHIIESLYDELEMSPKSMKSQEPMVERRGGFFSFAKKTSFQTLEGI